MRRSLEVGDIFRAYGPVYRDEHGDSLPVRHLRAMRAIELCRTAELGGHVDVCDHCGALKISYNSCRNRHCPKCQCLDKERWLEARKKDVLPTHYFHVVFTVPDALRPLALRNQRVVYNILFKSVSDTLKTLCKDPKHLGAEIGFIAILHTWSQTLLDHAHVHCIVPGGGLSADGKRWIGTKETFFIPVKVLSCLFRGKFLGYLKKAYDSDKLKFSGKIAGLKARAVFNDLLSRLYGKGWIVHCKPPFRKPDDVIDYLGRYTHRVALSNDRIMKLDGDQVTFRYRDSSDNDKTKLMTLKAFEFIRRFLLHVLPDGFIKIRHYGILSNRSRRTKLMRCKELLGIAQDGSEKQQRLSWQELLFTLTGIDPTVCPHCGKGKMVLKETVVPTLAPP
jgi:hypothetical protein